MSDRISRAASAWQLCLYIAGDSARSSAALANLERICRLYLPGQHHIEVIDLTRQPHLAARDQIVALPTLVRLTPSPTRRIIGDLSDEGRVISALGIPELATWPSQLTTLPSSTTN